MSLVGPKSQSLQKRAQKVLSLGVNCLTPYVEKAKGAYLWDMDGHRFIDYRMAFFPFSGWKDSFFGDMHGQGMDAVEFFTQKKVVVERWPKEWSRKF
jgi:4-aminobutyrate aminotransferase-like enzyme